MARIIQMPTSANQKKQKRPNRLDHLDRDRGYRFENRDPDMEWVCDEIEDSGLSTWAISQKVVKATGGAFSISPTTMNNWLSGKTRRPQNFTLNWVAYALGYERKWTKIS